MPNAADNFDDKHCVSPFASICDAFIIASSDGLKKRGTPCVNHRRHMSYEKRTNRTGSGTAIGGKFVSGGESENLTLKTRGKWI